MKVLVVLLAYFVFGVANAENDCHPSDTCTNIDTNGHIDIVGDTVCSNAFDGCTGLTSVTFPDSLQTIQERTFTNKTQQTNN